MGCDKTNFENVSLEDVLIQAMTGQLILFNSVHFLSSNHCDISCKIISNPKPTFFLYYFSNLIFASLFTVWQTETHLNKSIIFLSCPTENPRVLCGTQMFTLEELLSCREDINSVDFPLVK